MKRLLLLIAVILTFGACSWEQYAVNRVEDYSDSRCKLIIRTDAWKNVDAEVLLGCMLRIHGDTANVERFDRSLHTTCTLYHESEICQGYP